MTQSTTPSGPKPEDDSKKPRGFSPTLLVLAVIPLLGLAAALGLLLSNRDGRDNQPEATVGARVGSLDKPMPDFTVTSISGQTVDLTQYRGRPVFLNFWGTWCPPCVRELPALQAFAAAQGEDGAVIVAANNTEQPEAIFQFFEDNGLSLPDIEFVLDSDSAMYHWFGVYQMPSTYLIDRDGIVRSVKYGAFDTAGLQAYLDQLNTTQNSD